MGPLQIANIVFFMVMGWLLEKAGLMCFVALLFMTAFLKIQEVYLHFVYPVGNDPDTWYYVDGTYEFVEKVIKILLEMVTASSLYYLGYANLIRIIIISDLFRYWPSL